MIAPTPRKEGRPELPGRPFACSAASVSTHSPGVHWRGACTSPSDGYAVCSVCHSISIALFGAVEAAVQLAALVERAALMVVCLAADVAAARLPTSDVENAGVARCRDLVAGHVGLRYFSMIPAMVRSSPVAVSAWLAALAALSRACSSCSVSSATRAS